MLAGLNEEGSSAPPKRMRIGAVVDQPSSALRLAWLGIRPFAGWMLMVPSVVPPKYRSFGNGKTPCVGWNNAAVAAAGVFPPPGGRPLPEVGLVGPTSGELLAELEQPAVTNAPTKIITAADSLFITLLGNLFGKSERSHSLVVQNDAPALSYWGCSVRLGPKRWQATATLGESQTKRKKTWR